MPAGTPNGATLNVPYPGGRLGTWLLYFTCGLKGCSTRWGWKCIFFAGYLRRLVHRRRPVLADAPPASTYIHRWVQQHPAPPQAWGGGA